MNPKIKALFENISDDEPYSLKLLLNHPDYNIADGELMCPLGLIDENKLLSVDMSKIPHMLIGGTTGSGKTNFIQSIIISLFLQYGPDKCKFIIFDSKMVDYMSFCRMPHLIMPVINDASKGDGAILWAKVEALERIKAKKENREGTNNAHIFVILDDYSNIYNVDYVTDDLFELLKLGREANIHCILSTGLPLAKIIPTELKVLFPCRIAFTTVSKLTSRIIIDENGAELLTSPGEMLYRNFGPIIKCRCAHVTDAVMNIVTNQIESRLNDFLAGINIECLQNQTDSDGIDVYFEDAGRFLIEQGQATVSMLQRYFKIGVTRACRILDQLEDACVISAEQGNKPRNVLMSLEDFEHYLRSRSQSDIISEPSE